MLTYDEIDAFSEQELEEYIEFMSNDYNDNTYIFDSYTECEFEKLNYAKSLLTKIKGEKI